MLLLLLLLAAEPRGGRGKPRHCADDDVKLLEAIASHAETKSFASMVSGCADIKSRDSLIRVYLKKGACEIAQVKEFCPETCGYPCEGKACTGEPVGIPHLDVETSSLRGQECWCNWVQGEFCEPDPLNASWYAKHGEKSGLYDYIYVANFTNRSEQGAPFKLSYLRQELDAPYPFERAPSAQFVLPAVGEKDGKLGKCSGDCDVDQDCAGRLRCFHRTSLHNRKIPGCDLNASLDEDGGELNNGGRGTLSTIPAPLRYNRNEREARLFPFTDANKDYCYDPHDTPKYKCQDAALNDVENTVKGNLHAGQTCELDEAIVVPACTHLHLTGGTGESKAIISGKEKTNHFLVNGKLTLENLILEKGRAHYRGGSLHVQGFFALAHLIDTTIRNCAADNTHVEMCTGKQRSQERDNMYDGGGAIFLSSGSHLHERGITDSVGLILEGHTKILENTGTNGGGILSLGLDVEVRGSASVVVSRNSANPGMSLEYLEENDSGNGGGICIMQAGGLFVRERSELHIHGNTAMGVGGGISIRDFPQHEARAHSQTDLKGVHVEGNSHLHIQENSALTFGGGLGVLLTVGTFCPRKGSKHSLVNVSGMGSMLHLERNVAFGGGGLFYSQSRNVYIPREVVTECPRGVAAQQQHDVIVNRGGYLLVDSNAAESFAEIIQNTFGSTQLMTNLDGGSYLNSLLEEKGFGGGMLLLHAKLIVEGLNSTAQVTKNACHGACNGGGGLVAASSSSIAAVSGGVIEFNRNNASTRYASGGGAVLMGEELNSMSARGEGSSIRFQENFVQNIGGGLASMGPHKITVSDGASIAFHGNKANGHGGGSHIDSATALLSDEKSSVVFKENSAKKSGGGLSSVGGSIVHLHGDSIFENNIAKGVGGAIASHAHGNDRGDGTCVRIKISVTLINPYNPHLKLCKKKSLTKCEQSFRKYRSTMVTFIDVAARPLPWKIPPRISVKLLRPSLPNETLEILNDTVDGGVQGDGLEFIVNCVESGFNISNAKLSRNVANAGGAVAAVRKGIFFQFRNSSFTGNSAVKGGGGAIFLLGLQTGARFDDNCVFDNNSATESGGALSVGDAASVHVQDAYAINNRAGKNGGFASTSFASASLFEALTVQKSSAEHGSGGAFSFSATQVALSAVSVKSSHAGIDGGGLILDQGAEVHLLGSKLEANSADEKAATSCDIAAESSTFEENSAADGIGGAILRWKQCLEDSGFDRSSVEDPPELATGPFSVKLKYPDFKHYMASAETGMLSRKENNDSFIELVQIDYFNHIIDDASVDHMIQDVRTIGLFNISTFNIDSQCLMGHHGPLCASCKYPTFTMGSDGLCKLNKSGKMNYAFYFTLLAVCYVVLFIIVTLLVWRVKALPQISDKSKVNVISETITLLISYAQILSSLTETYASIEWGDSFVSFTSVFRFLNLDAMSIFPLLIYGADYNLSHEDKLCFHFANPVLIVLTIKFATTKDDRFSKLKDLIRLRLGAVFIVYKPSAMGKSADIIESAATPHQLEIEALIKHHERVKARNKLRKSRKMKNVPIFRDLDDKAISAVVEQMNMATFQPGDSIVVQGDKADTFYIILQGTCNVLQKSITSLVNAKLVAQLHQYDHFGESALVGAAKRLAATTQGKSPSYEETDRANFNVDVISETRNATIIAGGSIEVQVMTLAQEGLAKLVRKGAIDINNLRVATEKTHLEREKSSRARNVWQKSQFPLELVKTRLQVQSDPTAQVCRIYRHGFVDALRVTARTDGVGALWTHGFLGFVLRDFFYSGIRIGAYPSVRMLYAGKSVEKDDIGLSTKILAGATTGGVGSAIANPFDVVRAHGAAGNKLELDEYLDSR
eukprot:g4482.t1